MTNAVPMQVLVAVDWDNDGSFATSGDDISDYVKNTSAVGGISDWQSAVAYVGTCDMTLDNQDRRFSPANVASPYVGKLVSGLPIRVQITDGVTTWPLFYGFTSDFRAQPGIRGQRECALHCGDLLMQIQDEKINLPLLQNVTADALIKHIVNAALLAPTASGKLSVTAAPANNDTATINAQPYTFKTSLSGSANEILISSLLGTLRNFVAAVNNDTGVGTTYGTNTSRPNFITAASNVLTGYDVNNQDSDVLLRNTTVPVKDKLAQQFQVTGTVSVASALLYLKKVGAPAGTQTLRVESDSSGSPSGNLVDANATATLAESGLGTSYSMQTFAFAGSFTLQPNTVYWLVLSTSRAASGTAYVAWGADGSSPTYAYQNASGMKYNSSSAWSAENKTAVFVVGELSTTLTATLRGAIGNTFTLAESSAGLLVSGATLSGGTDYPTSPAPSLAAGIRTFDIAADTWGSADENSGTNGMSALEDTVQSERGLLWVARNGTLTFKNLDFQFQSAATTAALTINSELNDLEGALTYEDLYNRIEVNYTPRSTLSAGGVVAKSSGILQVPGVSGTARWNGTVVFPGGGSAVFRLPFVDPTTGKPMGAKSIITPLIPNTDWKANDNQDGVSGFDYTGNSNLSLSAAINGSNVEISIKNTALGPLYFSLLQVRGTGIVNYNPTVVVSEDSASQQQNRAVRVLPVDLPLPSGQTFAQALADYLLSRYKNEAYRVSSITFANQNKIGSVNLFSLNIGDVIQLTDYQTGVSSSKYLITGIQYSGIGPRTTGTITFNVRRLDDTSYAIYDDATYGIYDSAATNYSL